MRAGSHGLGVSGIALAVLVLAATSAEARPGDLDRSFGFFGAVVTQPEPRTSAGVAALAVQSDGRLLTAGAPSSRVVRYLPDGRIDPSFGDGGTANPPGAGYGALDVALQPDGRIVVADAWTIVSRLGADGRPDPNFGVAGRAELPPLPALCEEQSVGGLLEPTTFQPAALAVQADGKIVVVGALAAMRLGRNSWVCDRDLAVLRLGRDGRVDERFGRDGLVTLDFGARWGFAQAVAVDPRGRIVVAGSSCAVEGFAGGGHTYITDCAPERAGVVVRLERDGLLDARFGEAGIGSAASGVLLDVRAVAVAPDGAIVTLSSAPDGTLLSRLGARGLPDETYGAGGVFAVPAVVALDLVLDRRGRMLVAGVLGDWFGIVRLRRDGSLDPDFGFGGFVATVAGGYARALALDRDGRIVVAGERDAREDALVRLLGGP